MTSEKKLRELNVNEFIFSVRARAGPVVTKNVPNDTVVIGNPARILDKI